MIIAADIGNTNIKIGLFEEDRLIKSWRISTDVQRTSDEHGSILKQLFFAGGVDANEINGGIISSVIPQLNYTIMHMMEYYLDVIPIVVGAGIKTGLNIKYENPRELGSDRLINCVAAAKKYGAPFVLIDFGTATTFNVVNENNEFAGGCITVGIKTAAKALASSTARLPEVELKPPRRVINASTVKAIQSGIVYGTAGQVDYIIRRIKKETGISDLKVIATGGLSELVHEVNGGLFDIMDRELSLEGLNILYRLNN